MSDRPILEVRGLTKRFDGLTAVNDVDFALPAGRRHAVIGPNGAGKTTFFNLISGFLRPTAGRVLFDGQDVTGASMRKISRLGVARTLQIKSVFGGMTVAENVWIAAQSRGTIYSPFRSSASYADTQKKVDEILEITGLGRLATRKASALSYGDVALLEISIAMATQPKLLLLDEPVCGMSPAETERMVGLIKSLSETVNVVIIEHDMEVVFDLAEDITVMAQGAILAQGAPAEIAADPAVREAYLGDPEDEDDEDEEDENHDADPAGARASQTAGQAHA